MTLPYKLIITVTISLISSCSIVNMFDTSGNYEYGKNGLILDSSRNRDLLLSAYKKQIEDEALGLYPKHPWERGWRMKITSLRDGKQENPEFYVQYIIQERRKRGLPELKL